MALVNVSKPSTSLVNADRIASFETWATILSVWSGETRSWDDCLSLMDNLSKITSAMTNTNKPT